MKRPDWFLLGMAAAVGLAWAFPEPGAKGGSLRPELLNRGGVALIFFLHGLTLSFAQLSAGTLRWKLHVVVQVATFIVFPLLGLGALWMFRPALGPELGLGLFFLCALPSTVSSSIALTAAARGNVSAAVFNATLSGLLGVFLTPLWVGLVVGRTGHTLPLGPVVLGLVTWLLLPLVAGQAMRPLLGAFATRHRARIGLVDRLTILVLVYTSFCDSVVGGVWSNGFMPLAVSVLTSSVLLGIMMLFVSAVSRGLAFPEEDRIAALFCGSKKSLATGVPMARLMFGAHPGLGIILLPIMIYHSLQLVVGGVLAARYARRDPQ